MVDWKEYKIKDFCEFKYGKNLPESKRVPGKFPVYGSSKITGYHNDYLVKGPGIIIGRKGTVGRVQFSKENFFPIDTTFYINEDKSKVDLKYLYYRLPLCGFEEMNSDAAVPGLNRSAAVSQKIRLPQLTTQRKIATILSAYDDLIENNLKRIKLLEESSNLIYEQWYLNRIINNTIISDNYIRIEALESLIDKYINGGWGKDEYQENYVNEAFVIRGTDMPKVSMGQFDDLPLRFHTESNLNSRLLKHGDIAVEMSNGNIDNVGRSFYFDKGLSKLLGKPTICASFCKMIRPKSVEISYLIDAHLKYIYNSNKMLVYKAQAANGINNFNFEEMIRDEELYIPKGETLKFLVNSLKYPYELISSIRIQNSLLKEARDILLPRLMTGIIDVEKLNFELLDNVVNSN